MNICINLLLNIWKMGGVKIYTRRRVREIMFAETGGETRVRGLAIAKGEKVD